MKHSAALCCVGCKTQILKIGDSPGPESTNLSYPPHPVFQTPGCRFSAPSLPLFVIQFLLGITAHPQVSCWGLRIGALGLTHTRLLPELGPLVSFRWFAVGCGGAFTPREWASATQWRGPQAGTAAFAPWHGWGRGSAPPPHTSPCSLLSLCRSPHLPELLGGSVWTVPDDSRPCPTAVLSR